MLLIGLFIYHYNFNVTQCIINIIKFIYYILLSFCIIFT